MLLIARFKNPMHQTVITIYYKIDNQFKKKIMYKFTSKHYFYRLFN